MFANRSPISARLKQSIFYFFFGASLRNNYLFIFVKKSTSGPLLDEDAAAESALSCITISFMFIAF